MFFRRGDYIWLLYDSRLFITQPQWATTGLPNLSPDSIRSGLPNWKSLPPSAKCQGSSVGAKGQKKKTCACLRTQTCPVYLPVCNRLYLEERFGGTERRRGGWEWEGGQLKGLGGKNVVINCWQQIQGEDYWTVTQRQMSDECLLTCFLHLVGCVADEFRPGGLVPPNRRGW